MITEKTIVSLVKNPEVVDMAGEKVMADFATGKYYMFKGAAGEIWESIQTDLSVEELKNKLLDIFEVDEETCLRNTISFLEQLHENGFVQLK